MTWQAANFFLIFKWEQWQQTEWLPTGRRQTWTDNNSSGQTRWLWESSFTSESTFHYTVYTARSRYDPKKSFTLFPSLHAENSLHSSASILYSTALRKKPRILSHPSPCPHWGNWFLVCRKPFWHNRNTVIYTILIMKNLTINIIHQVIAGFLPFSIERHIFDLSIYHWIVCAFTLFHWKIFF